MTNERQRDKFAGMVLPHLDAALSLARWLAGSTADAEDIVQDACIRALGSVDACRGEARPWFLAIVRNCAWSWLARNRRTLKVVTNDERLFERASNEIDDGAMSAEAILVAESDREMLRAGIEALPLAFREVLVLREFEDLSYRQISDVTGTPVGTVMSRLARARQFLMGYARQAQDGAKGDDR